MKMLFALLITVSFIAGCNDKQSIKITANCPDRTLIIPVPSDKNIVSFNHANSGKCIYGYIDSYIPIDMNYERYAIVIQENREIKTVEVENLRIIK